MAIATNGRPKEPSKGKSISNGSAKNHKLSNGNVIANTSPNIYKRQWSLVGIVIRLVVWYTIITTLFRCPSSTLDLTNKAPRVCKPYLDAKSFVTPYLRPYYDSYALPYVDVARPYAQRFKRQIYTPSVRFSQQSYENYAAPKLLHLRSYGQDQWEKALKPQIDAAQAQGRKQYESTFAPQIRKVSAAVAPYYEAGQNKMIRIYNAQVLPKYAASRPYFERVYNLSHKIVIETSLPYAQSTWNATATFINRIVWPRLRTLYGENVEPQLVRIGERLGRYRDRKKPKMAVENIISSASSSPVSLDSTSISSIAPLYTTTISALPDASPSSEKSASSSLTPDQETEQTREKIESDLKNWQDKFAKAANKGTENLQGRVTEIIDRQIKSQVDGVGHALLTQLEHSTTSELAKIKRSIIGIVKTLPADRTQRDLENAENELSTVIRNAGLAVKTKAQALRTWKQAFEQETKSLVTAASESTLEVIDNIRDLGLQEIGMRWAWMEGVTYKDWSDYHLLKKTFDKWRQEVEVVAQSHEGIQKCKDAAYEVEIKGMRIAEEAAKELRRVKEVGRWKIQAVDASDDFSTKQVPATVVAAGQNIKEKLGSASEQVADAYREGGNSFVAEVAKKGGEAVSSASSVMASTGHNLAEQVSTKISEVSNAARSAATDVVSGTPQSKVESVVSGSNIKASRGFDVASEAMIGTPALAYEASVSGSSTSVVGTASANSDAGSGPSALSSESASSAAGKASKRVFAGALAQKVEKRDIVLDNVDNTNDDVAYSETFQSILNSVGDKYADAAKAVSEALIGNTRRQGSIERTTSVAREQYSSAFAAASSVLYGTQKGTMESVTSVAADKYAEAVSIASSIIYGTPTPLTQAAAAEASAIYSRAASRALSQYSHAVSIASEQISGTPKPVHQDIFSSLEASYSSSLEAVRKQMQLALGGSSTTVSSKFSSPHSSILSAAYQEYSVAASAASSQFDAAKSALSSSPTATYENYLSIAGERYSDLMSAASSKLAFATAAVTQTSRQGVLESISSVASSRLADSLSIASAQYSNIKTAIGATSTPVRQEYLTSAQRQYYEAIGLAHERYTEFLNAASSVVYGTPTPVHQSLYSVASESLYGKPTPAYQSVLDAAQSKYSIVVSQASDNLKKVLASASSATDTTRNSPVQNILDSASSQYSSALSAASATLSAAAAAVSTGIHGTPIEKKESILSMLSDEAHSISSTLSTAVIGTETPWTESMASQASENWEALISKASERIYGAPTPFSQPIVSQAGAYAAQVTGAAAAQYEAVQSLFLEVMNGKEPDFTQSVMNRLSSAYYTGVHVSIASSASSYANDAYTSASSAISSMFTPPATLEAIINNAGDQVNAALEAASIQYYGTSKGSYEKATSAAAGSYSSVQSAVSEAVYGSQPGYLESVGATFEDIASSARSAISDAIYGTTTVASADVTDAAGQAYASASSIIVANAAAAGAAIDATKAKVSEVVYGPEQSALESAASRLTAAIESAKARLAEFPEGASDAFDKVKSGVEAVANSVSSAAAAATNKVRDEL